MAELAYRQLTKKKRSLAGYSQLWLGQDHVLLVNSSRFSERYQRFLLSDIQAISVTAGPDVLALQLLAGVVAVAWGMLALMVKAIFGKSFFAISGVLFLILVFIDMARGPRCRCLLYTAVSQLRLRPVARQRIARSMLAVLSPAIEEVQGSLPAGARPVPLVEDPSAPPEPPPHGPGRISAAQVLFGLYLADALIVLMAYWFPRASASLIFPTAVLGELLLAAIALAQKRSRRVVIIALVVIGAVSGVYDLFTLGRAFWAAAMRGVFEGPTAPDIAAILSPALQAVLFASIWRIVLGAAGLLTWMFSSEPRPSA
jgi:hypothetical protein